MSIIIYTSRQCAGVNPARERLINRIITSYKETPFNERSKIFVVTPRQDTYQVERELIEKIGDGGLFGLQVLDFERLLELVVTNDGNIPDIVDEHGRLMLMQKTLVDVKDTLTVYNSSADKQGFAEQAVTQISELKRAQITPEMLAQSSVDFSGSLLADKMNDLEKIYRRFSEHLGEDRMDEDDFLAYALEISQNSDLLDGAQIFFLDHSTLDYSQALFMIMAQKKAFSIEAAFISEENRSAPDMSAFLSANESLDSFRRLSAEAGVRAEFIQLPVRSKNSPLAFLSSELFSYLPSSYSKEQNQIKLYKEKNPWEEVTRVAQLIASQNQKGTELSKIAVVMSDRETYESIIRRVFAQYRIPIFIDDNHQVTDNHFIQSLLFALDAAQSDFNRADMLAYIKSDFSGLTPEESDLLENYVIEAGIRPWEWKKPFKRLPWSWQKDEKTLKEDSPVNLLRERLISNLGILSKKSKKTLTYNDHIRRLKRFLERTQSQQKLSDLSEQIAQAGSQELASRYRQIWNILIEILEQMSRALGDMEASLGDFISVFKAGLSSYEIGVIPEDKNAVIIATLERTKLPEIESIYLVGANEGKLPKSLPDNSLFTEHDRKRLSSLFNLNEGQIRSRSYLHKLEELNLYTQLTKASKSVTLTWASFDSDGSQALLSRYGNVLEEKFGSSVHPKPIKLFNLLSPSRAEAILESMNPEERVFWQARRIINEWFSLNPQYDLKLLPRELIRARGDDVLKKHNAADLYHLPGQAMRVSASRLEQFANCPFRHFLQYGLRPRPREEYEVRALDTGIIVHEVFDRFIKNINKQADGDTDLFKEIVRNYVDNTDRLEKDCTAVFEEVFSQREDAKRYEHSAASRYLIVKIKRIIFTALLMMLNQLSQSGYIPETTEQAFAELTESGVIVEGRIDRVDLPPYKMEEEEVPVRVVDYKTGTKKISYTDLYYGRSLQLSLYLSEAVKAYQKKWPAEIYPGGAFYFLTDNAILNNPHSDNPRQEAMGNYKMVGLYNKDQEAYLKDEVKRSSERAKFTPGKLEKTELKSLLEHTQYQVRHLTERLISGDISIAPARIKGEDVGCEYCSFTDICRYNGADKNCQAHEMSELEKDIFFDKLKTEGEEDE